MCINLVGFRLAIFVESLLRCILKIPTQMSVIWGGTGCFLRGGGPALCVRFKFKRGTFFKSGPVKERTPSPVRQVLLVPSLYLWPRLFLGGPSCLYGNSADPSQMHFLFAWGPHGIKGAGLPLFNLFKKRSIILSVPR